MKPTRLTSKKTTAANRESDLYYVWGFCKFEGDGPNVRHTDAALVGQAVSHEKVLGSREAVTRLTLREGAQCQKITTARRYPL